MFDVERFVQDCRETVGNGGTPAEIAALLRRALERPAEVIDGLGAPSQAGGAPLYQSAELSIFNVVWGANQIFRPHDHAMWAVIGLYTGREDNIIWKRSTDQSDARIRPAAAKAISVGECAVLGKDVIHSVINPIPRLTGAIQIYGGDLINARRSEWDAETLTEQEYDTQRALTDFERASQA